VTEATRAEESGASALPLDDGIGDQGGGVRDAAGSRRVAGRGAVERAEAIEDPDRGIRGRGEPLLDLDLARRLVEQDEVRERAADVAPDAEHQQAGLSRISGGDFHPPIKRPAAESPRSVPWAPTA